LPEIYQQRNRRQAIYQQPYCRRLPLKNNGQDEREKPGGFGGVCDKAWAGKDVKNYLFNFTNPVNPKCHLGFTGLAPYKTKP